MADPAGLVEDDLECYSGGLVEIVKTCLVP